MADYRPRIADAELSNRLRSAGAVLIEGARACGKTETARRQAATAVFLDDPNSRSAARAEPGMLLVGTPPVLLDEWQLAPDLWNAVRREVDDRRADGQFILTGSATPADDVTRHTGAGRFSRLRMRPMSLFESGESNGTVSLTRLLEGDAEAVQGNSRLSVDDLIELSCRGGWPANLERDLAGARDRVRDYVEELQRAELVALDGVQRDPVRVRAVLIALARNLATEASMSTLARDAGELLDGGRPRVETVTDYLVALERVMAVEPQPAWAPHLRSRARVRVTPKAHFVDPSLAIGALGAGPADLRRDLEFFGLVFESLVVRDLRVYAQPFRGGVHHYRDSTGLEVDAIVTAGGDRWAAFEVKLGASAAVIDPAAAGLLKFADRVDTRRCGAPAAIAVVVSSGYAYRRPDGVFVIPVGTLGP